MLHAFCLDGGIVGGKKVVGVGVAQVVAEGHFNVGISFDDSRAKILIALDDEEPMILADIAECAGLVR